MNKNNSLGDDKRSGGFMGIVTTDMVKNITDVFLSVGSNMSETELQQEEDKRISDEIWAGRVGIYGIGGTVIAIFGLVGNVISIIVLSQYRQKSSAPLLLILLALYDSIMLGSELMLETLVHLAAANLIPKSYNTWVTPGYVLFVSVPFIARTGTTFMTVIITIERYIAVVKPFLAVRVCKRSAALKASAVVCVWCIIYHIPRYMAYTHYDQWNDDTNSTKIIFNRTEFGDGFVYNVVYITWINFTLEFLLPCSILVVLNVLILIDLRKSGNLGVNKPKNKSRRDGQRLTAMVLAVTTMFFFCELFSATSLIMVRGMNNYSECSVACNNFMSLADTMVIFNSACNFILYCAVGKKFRDIFFQLFCRCLSYRKSTSKGGSRSTHNTNTTSLGHYKTHL